jgi:hypothetical protein
MDLLVLDTHQPFNEASRVTASKLDSKGTKMSLKLNIAQICLFYTILYTMTDYISQNKNLFSISSLHMYQN